MKDPNPNVGSVKMVEGKPSQGEKRKKTYKGTLTKSNPLKMGVGNAKSSDI